MSLRLPRRRIFRFFVYLCCILLVLLAIDLLFAEWRRQIRPGYLTTRIVEPRLPDDSIDYLTAIEQHFGNGVTPQQNAVVPMLNAFGRAALPANQPEDGITARLGMPHLPKDGDYYVNYHDYCRQHGTVPEDDPTESGAWPPKISDATKQWLRQNDRPLAKLNDASQRPRFFVPFNGGARPRTLLEIGLPHVPLLRDAAFALRMRAAARLEQGDVDGFRADVLAVHRLARLLSTASTMVERNVAMKDLERPACLLDRAAAAGGKISAKQLRECNAELASLGELPPMDDVLDVSERFLALDTMQFLARGGVLETPRRLQWINSPGGGPFPPPPVVVLTPIPYEATMRTLNHFYDATLTATHGGGTYAARKESLDRLFTEVDRTSSSHGEYTRLLSSDWPVAMLFPAWREALRTADNTRCEFRLTQLAIALASFKADHGSYPNALTELVPNDLPSLPNDPFGDQPFHYQRTGDRYRLSTAVTTGKGDISVEVAH